MFCAVLDLVYDGQELGSVVHVVRKTACKLKVDGYNGSVVVATDEVRKPGVTVHDAGLGKCVVCVFQPAEEFGVKDAVGN